MSPRQIQRFTLVSAALLMLLLAGLALLFIDTRLDRSFDTYRYVANVSSGAGLVYNPGQRGLIPGVSPAYAILLAVGARLESNVPFLSNLISVLAVGLGGVAIFGISWRKEVIGGALAALIYIGFPLLWLTIGLDVALWMGACLTGLWLYVVEREALAAPLLVMGLLLKPETILLIAVVVAYSLLRRKEIKSFPTIVLIAGAVGGFVWGATAFNNPLALLGAGRILDQPDILAPSLIGGLGAFTAGMLTLSWLWAAVIGLALIGLLTGWKEASVILLGVWVLLHFGALTLLNAPVASWNMLPLVPLIALLAGLGIGWLIKRFEDQPVWLVGGVTGLLVVWAVAESTITMATTVSTQQTRWQALAPASVDPVDVQIGLWLADNTPQDASVGVTYLGALGYRANRTLIDFTGTLQPELADAYARRDGSLWLAELAPDYVVLSAEEHNAMFLYQPVTDPWFNAHYAEVARFNSPEGSHLIFQRTLTPSQINPVIIGLVEYPQGVIVNGLGVDFSLFPLDGDRHGRLRLQWLVDNPPDTPQVIGIRLQGRGETEAIAALVDYPIDFSAWPRGDFITTYHSIELLPTPSPGVYDLEIGIGPDPFNLTWQSITTAKVPFPEVNVLGGVSGLRVDFSSVSITGYRLARTEQGLEVLLLWQTQVPPGKDYTVRIEVRSTSGEVVAVFEGEPHGGIYPTGVWAAGERVPDTYLVDIGDVLPGEYDVYAGLVSSDGSFLRTAEGETMAQVGRFVINQ